MAKFLKKAIVFTVLLLIMSSAYIGIMLAIESGQSNFKIAEEIVHNFYARNTKLVDNKP